MDDNPRNLLEPVKRTTILVSNLERSLTLYQGLFGMDVFYDVVVKDGLSEFFAWPMEPSRIVILQSQGLEFGMIGLMEITGANPPPEPQNYGLHPRLGEMIFVIKTKSLKHIYERLEDHGCTIISPPTKIDVPGRPELWEMLFRDPDGALINLSQDGAYS